MKSFSHGARRRGHPDATDVIQDPDLPATLVRASAGTGKTYQLTARLLRILMQGAAPETVLATTFTRKAAGEILDRILLTLAAAANEADNVALEQLRQQVGIDDLSHRACRELLHRLIRNVHRLRICTLDSLFTQIARSFPFELGLPPAWRLTDEIEESWLRQRAVEQLIAELDSAEMTTLLSMLGKGETKRAIARELMQVVLAAYGQQRHCGDQAWKRLRVPKKPDSQALNDAIGMMRACEEAGKRHQTKLQDLADTLEQGDLSSLTKDTIIRNIASSRRSKSPVTYYRKPFPAEVEPAFDTLYRAVCSEILGLLQFQNVATGQLLSIYDRHITQLKQSVRTLGFDDVAVRLATRFGKQVDGVNHLTLARRLDGAINHVLLDEFQDTSPIQWQVLRPLAMQAAGGSKDDPSDRSAADHSFFCVGDTKQAIYGWRGGVAEIFDAVADEIPDVVEVGLHQSFRSSPVVIDVVNETFQNLDRHPLSVPDVQDDPADKSTYEAEAIRRFCRRFDHHVAARGELSGHVLIETCPLSSQADTDAKKFNCFESTAEAVAQLNAVAPQRSIGILTRTNAAVGQMIFLLEQLNVEVSQEGGNPLTDSAAVEMVLSALMMVEHPGDRRWRFHLSNSPLADPDGSRATALRSMLENDGIAQTVEHLCQLLAPQCERRDIERMKQLTHLAISLENDRVDRVRDFVYRVRETRIERPQSAPVRVMTVHQSKGLEFDTVFLPELDATLTRSGGQCVADTPQIGQPAEGLTRYLPHQAWHFLPKRWQKAFGAQAAAEMTEALCLLYVAMTRARQALYVKIIPTHRKSFEVRTAASLLFHALECDGDPTQGDTVLFEKGDADWYEDGDGASPPRTGSAKTKEIPTRNICFPNAATPRPSDGNPAVTRTN